jgi:hypothetical protein
VRACEGKRARGYIARVRVVGVGKRARGPGCKYMHYILKNVSMAARMEGILGALEGDIKNAG